MKVQITVGPVEVAAAGLDLTVRDVRNLMRHATDLALVVLDKVSEEDEAEPSTPIGFACITEIASTPALDTLDDDDE